MIVQIFVNKINKLWELPGSPSKQLVWANVTENMHVITCDK